MFNVKVHLPSGQSVRIPELKNRDFFSILKFCENEDIEGLHLFLKKTVLQNCISFDIIDQLYILLFIRMIFIEPEIFFEDSERRTINYAIQNMLEKIELQRTDLTQIIKRDKFEIELCLPNIIYFESLNDIYLNVIKTIKLNNNTINFYELHDQEKEEILQHIPNAIFSCINTYISEVSDKLSEFVIIDENAQFNINKTSLNILSNGVIHFIMFLFSSGLSSFFEMMYVFTKQLNFTLSDFYDLTPLDSKVIFNIYRKEMKEAAEEALKNQNQQ